MSEVSINETRDNSVNDTGTSRESLSPGSCPMDRTCGPGCHQATVRRRWLTQDNICLVKCYYESQPELRGYGKRLLTIWEEKKSF